MKRVKLTDNFYLDEFVCPEIYSARGGQSIHLLDMRIIMAVQYLREQIGKPIKINDWWSGGHYHESGLREFTTKTGARLSQHKFGRAVDIKVSGMTPREVYEVVMQNEEYLIEHQLITTIESLASTPSWLHIDCRYTGLDKILIVNP